MKIYQLISKHRFPYLEREMIFFSSRCDWRTERKREYIMHQWSWKRNQIRKLLLLLTTVQYFVMKKYEWIYYRTPYTIKQWSEWMKIRSNYYHWSNYSKRSIQYTCSSPLLYLGRIYIISHGFIGLLELSTSSTFIFHTKVTGLLTSYFLNYSSQGFCKHYFTPSYPIPSR